MAPRIDRLSQHQRNDGETGSIFIYGEGFREVVGVAFGDQWSPDYRVDGETVITASPPQMPAGSTVWVVVHTTEDGESPCEGDAQMFSVVALEAAPVGGDLLLDSITPEEITLGRNEPYWILGSGLGGVTGVMLASSACQFECYDDGRLVFWVPEQVSGATADGESELVVFSSSGDSKQLRVTCRTVPVDEGNQSAYPTVGAIEPTQLGAEGGFVTITGDSFRGVVGAYLGDVELLNIDVVSSTELKATVPMLDSYVGQQLEPLLVTSDYSSPSTSARLTVIGS